MKNHKFILKNNKNMGKFMDDIKAMKPISVELNKEMLDDYGKDKQEEMATSCKTIEAHSKDIFLDGVKYIATILSNEKQIINQLTDLELVQELYKRLDSVESYRECDDVQCDDEGCRLHKALYNYIKYN